MSGGALPPLGLVRAFESAARHLSFTEAARELNLSQAAISKQIRLLEAHLGQQLFVRLPRSLALTAAGDAWRPKVRDALERLELGTDEVFGRQRADVLTIRCAVSFAVNWLAPRMPAFLARRPGARIRLISSVWNEASADRFDIDIQYGAGDWADGVSHRLTRESLTPLCSPAIAASLREPADLNRHQLLHVVGYQQGWATWLAAARVGEIDPGGGIQCDTSLAAFSLAAHGCGVALGRTSLTADVLRAGTLVAPFPLSVPVEEAFWLVLPRGPQRPLQADFTGWLLEEAAL